MSVFITVDGKRYALRPDQDRVVMALPCELSLVTSSEQLDEAILKTVTIPILGIDHEEYRIRQDHKAEWRAWRLRGEDWVKV